MFIYRQDYFRERIKKRISANVHLFPCNIQARDLTSNTISQLVDELDNAINLKLELVCLIPSRFFFRAQLNTVIRFF